MGTTPTKLLQGLQKGGKDYTSLRTKAAVRELAKTDPLAKRLIYGGNLTRRQTIQYAKALQKADSYAFTQRNVRTVINALERKEAMHERLAEKSDTKEKDMTLQRGRDREERKKEAYAHTKELEAEGKRASLAHRPGASISITQTHHGAGDAAPSAPVIDMPID